MHDDAADYAGLPARPYVIPCPACGYHIETLKPATMGSVLPAIPMVCGSCAGVFLLTLDTVTAEQLPDTAWEFIRSKNPKLMEDIERTQASVREGLRRARRVL